LALISQSTAGVYHPYSLARLLARLVSPVNSGRAPWKLGFAAGQAFRKEIGATEHEYRRSSRQRAEAHSSEQKLANAAEPPDSAQKSQQRAEAPNQRSSRIECSRWNTGTLKGPASHGDENTLRAITRLSFELQSSHSMQMDQHNDIHMMRTSRAPVRAEGFPGESAGGSPPRVPSRWGSGKMSGGRSAGGRSENSPKSTLKSSESYRNPSKKQPNYPSRRP